MPRREFNRSILYISQSFTKCWKHAVLKRPQAQEISREQVEHKIISISLLAIRFLDTSG